jgi:hypothetical protein
VRSSLADHVHIELSLHLGLKLGLFSHKMIHEEIYLAYKQGLACDVSADTCSGTSVPSSSSHNKIHTVLIRLHRTRPKPKPLHRALTRNLALRTKIRRHSDAERRIVRRQHSQVLISVAIELDERLADDGISSYIDDGDIGRSLVWDG